jgi:LysM repeat protein
VLNSQPKTHNSQLLTRNSQLATCLFLLAICHLLFATPVAAQQGPTNLLVNGDFEWWDWNVNSWPLQDGISEVQVCPGWRAFYVDTPPEGVAPETWKRPEFRDVKTAEFPYRVRSGFLAQKYFTFGGQHIAGLYQQVGNIAPGTPLRFSVYMHTWGCMAGTDSWNICPTGEKSNNPPPMHTKVGIDPTGGTNPWAATVVWSAEQNAYDVWTLFQVEARAQNSTVTVFTYSYAHWFDNVFRIHNDVYIDDASLINLNAAPAQPPAPQPTSPPAPQEDATPASTNTPAPTATPFLTPTPDVDGAIRHIVQSGETLSVIADLYVVSQDTLMQNNVLTDANVLEVGQVLFIVLPVPTITPLPPTSTPTSLPPTATPSPLPSLTPTSPPHTATPRSTALPFTSTPLPTSTPATQSTSLGSTFIIGVGVLGIVATISVLLYVFLIKKRE